ncbi:DUF429 domain-containing protein [Natronomonas marina]|uniref:DUF429 domain-containing protein n=1 Tax=Natronomonas marina TaxID=2961939 RepID=UPI0020C9EC6E|nr:DUF429 domain-containing protein [Natronomonas marina]
MEVRGVDFSGSAEPGCDIWLADGRFDGDRLEVLSCRPAAEAFGATARKPVLEALAESLRTREGTTGLDFSFGLPAALLPPEIDGWAESVEWFAREFREADADGMREALKRRARASDADGVELKRRTDDAVRANSPYSFITYYQTLYGVRDLLAPLVADGAVSAPPMQAPGDPNLVEIYPAGTLRRLDTVDEGYKEATGEARGRREEILAALDAETALEVRIDDEVRERAVAESGGDALDSVVAAVATARAVDRGFEPTTPHDEREGCIYV